MPQHPAPHPRSAMALVWGGVWGTITVVKEVERPVGDSATTLATCEGRSEDRSNKNGGASKENGEHRSEKARPATVLARGSWSNST